MPAAWESAPIEGAQAASQPTWASTPVDTAAAPAKAPAAPIPDRYKRMDPPEGKPGKTISALMGIGTGVGNTALGAQYWIGRGLKKFDEAINRPLSSLITGQPTSMMGKTADWLIYDAEMGRAKLADELKPYADENPLSAEGGKLTGEVVATLPVGGVLGKVGMKALPYLPPSVVARIEPFLQSIGTSGMSTGRAAATTTAAKAADMGTRMVGGAVTGGASAALVEPDSATSGAVIGALVPPGFKLVGKTGEAIGALIRPLTASGQGKIVADVLKQYANDPQAALAALKAAAQQQLVPGSAPLTAAVTGDVGLSGLTRTLQNTSNDFAGELTNRITNQNAARTAALEGIAGNKGKVAVAQQARDAATDAMRESALQRAGTLDANAIAAQIEGMLANPNNAGSTTRAGLQRALGQIRDIAGESGQIDARALYEIRKDLGLAMQGELQGDAGNLRYARGALSDVQNVFDDAIEAASRRPATAPGTELALAGSNVALPGAAGGTPATSWRDYLSKYSELSKPINQMEALQDVLKRVQTGTPDTQGNLMLSGAKLNQILKNEGDELAKQLTPEQMQQLRNLAADLNASYLALNAGKATGSNTVQNLAQDQLLQTTLGRLGNSQAVQTTLGNLLKLPYVRANQSIQQRLGEALLDPVQAARLMEQAAASPTLSRLAGSTRELAYRGLPVLPATAQ